MYVIALLALMLCAVLLERRKALTHGAVAVVVSGEV